MKLLEVQIREALLEQGRKDLEDLNAQLERIALVKSLKHRMVNMIYETNYPDQNWREEFIELIKQIPE